MADNTTLNSGTGGDTYRSVDRGGAKRSVAILDLGGQAGPEALLGPNAMPVSGSVSVTNLPGTQPVSGTVAVSNLPGTQPVSGTVAISQPDPAPTAGTISAADAGTATVVNALGQSIVTGTPTASSFVGAATSGESTARIELVGTTFNGTILVEKSDDGGATYFATNLTGPNIVGTVASAAFTGAASTQQFRIDLAGITNVRVRCSARSAGSLAVTIQPAYGVVEVTVPGGVTLNAGENHVGEVGGNSALIVPTLAVTASSAYVSGYSLGGVLTLTNAMRKSGGTGVLQTLVLVDQDNQKPTMDILIFNQAPAGTYADHAAFTWNAADYAKLIARVSVLTSDWATVGGVGIAAPAALGKVVAAIGTANLFAVMVVSATPTYAGTGKLSAEFGFLRD